MKQQTVMAHDFAMNPSRSVPRTGFPIRKGVKKTFDAGYLIPILCEEVLPGDTISVNCTAVLRMATPIVPIMDNMYVTTFFFFGPIRLVWDNARKMFGEQDSPGDSTSYTVPEVTVNTGGYPVGSVFDHFGLPLAGQVAGGNNVPHNVLPLRLHNLTYNQHFRDENLQPSVTVSKTDGPDPYSNYSLYRRGKRFDLFTQALPFLQKGNPVSLPLAGNLPVYTSATINTRLASTALQWTQPGNTGTIAGGSTIGVNANVTNSYATLPAGVATQAWPSNLFADAGAVSMMNINDLRLANATQEYLERDARSGTRYTEYVYGHFHVRSPDQRLQRVEYLGGGTAPVNINPVEQQSGTGATGTTTPAGYLAAYATAALRNGFSQSFTEHGYLLGYMCVDADLTYQQGLRKLWSRKTKFDFYVPTLANLGEQAVYNKELYVRGDANDNLVFGYIPRWDELRTWISEIHGLYRSTSAGTIDYWHLSQRFTSLPTLNATWIVSTPPLSRVLAGGVAADGQQFLADILYTGRMTRSIPAYSIPSLMSRF